MDPTRALLLAIDEDDIKGLQILLEEIPQVDNGVVRAVLWGDNLTIFLLFLQKFPKQIHRIGSEEMNDLIANNQYDMVSSLWNCKVLWNEHSLEAAIQSGNENMLDLLFHQPGFYQMNQALSLAITYKKLNLVNFLLGKGYDVTSLILATVLKERMVSVLQLLIHESTIVQENIHKFDLILYNTIASGSPLMVQVVLNEYTPERVKTLLPKLLQQAFDVRNTGPLTDQKVDNYIQMVYLFRSHLE